MIISTIVSSLCYENIFAVGVFPTHKKSLMLDRKQTIESICQCGCAFKLCIDLLLSHSAWESSISTHHQFYSVVTGHEIWHYIHIVVRYDASEIFKLSLNLEKVLMLSTIFTVVIMLDLLYGWQSDSDTFSLILFLLPNTLKR